MLARWIRLGATGPLEFETAYSGLAAAQSRGASPILLWGESAAEYLFALIASRKHAPGRPQRWLSWGLAPAVATYRQFGVPAYLDAHGVWLHGRRIAEACARPIGDCAVIASSFLARFPEACVATPSFELEQAFRLRLEAQHGWQFEHSWPHASPAPKYAIV